MSKRKSKAAVDDVMDFFETLNPVSTPAARPILRTSKDLSDLIDLESRREELAHEIFEWLTKRSDRKCRGSILFAFEIGKAAGRVGGLLATQSIIREQGKRLSAIERINLGREVSAKERGEVERLNRELFAEFPRDAPRYREIARLLDSPQRPIKEGRVRYIIEGPRKVRSAK